MSESRPKRWEKAVQKAVEALAELQDIQSEYQDSLDNIPENLTESAYGEKLSIICDIDINSALQIAEDCETADLPMGFGRD